MKTPAPKKPLKTGYWTIDVLPDGGYTVAYGFGATRATFACAELRNAVFYILKHARGAGA